MGIIWIGRYHQKKAKFNKTANILRIARPDLFRRK